MLPGGYVTGSSAAVLRSLFHDGFPGCSKRSICYHTGHILRSSGSVRDRNRLAGETLRLGLGKSDLPHINHPGHEPRLAIGEIIFPLPAEAFVEIMVGEFWPSFAECIAPVN